MGNSHSSAIERFRSRRQEAQANLDLPYTKPSGLYPTCAWDPKHVRRLIMRRELAPRYPGRDDPCEEAQEECPICMLVYPALNETRCCSARLCTECYLQIRPPRHNKEPCPFCKYKRIEATFNGPRDQREIDREMRDEKRALEAMKRATMPSSNTPAAPSTSSQPSPSTNTQNPTSTPLNLQSASDSTSFANTSSQTASIVACPPSTCSHSDLPPSDSSFCQEDHRSRFYSPDAAPQLDPLLLEAMASEATYSSTPHPDRPTSSPSPSASAAASASASYSSLRDHQQNPAPFPTADPSPRSSQDMILLHPLPRVVRLPWYDAQSNDSSPLTVDASFSHADNIYDEESVSLNEAIRRSLIDM